LHPKADKESVPPGTDQLSLQVQALATHPSAPTGCEHFTNGVIWPSNGYYFYCGANPALYRTVASSAASNTPPHLRNTLQNANVYIYVFRTAAQYELAATRGQILPPEQPLATVPRLRGYTRGGTYLGTPLRIIAVFEEVTGVGPVSQPDLATATKHEMGHALDYIWGKASSKPKYTGLLASDWNTLNSFSRSILFPNGLPKYYLPNVTNEQIVKDLWPQIFKPDSVKGYAELYAWEFCAQASCDPDVGNPYYPQIRLSNLLIPLSKFPKTRQYFKDLWYNRGTPL
jgi:hypothetical protein